MAALVLIGLPVFLLCLGVPIFVALIAAASIGIVAMGIGSMAPVHVALFGGLDNFPLLAVPLFIFAGEVMGRGGIARRLVEWALSIVGGVVGAVRIDVGLERRLRRRHRAADGAGADPARLYRAVRRQPDRVVRRHR